MGARHDLVVFTSRLGFYFLRVDGRPGRTFRTKRGAATAARRATRSGARVTVWYRDLVGQDVPVLWRAR